MKLISLFIVLLLSPEVFAHDHNHDHEEAKDEVRVLQSVDLDNKAKAYVVARHQGHIVGQPFQVELRLNCSGAQKEVNELPIHDSMSVCDIDPQSLKMNRKKTAVAMKTKMADFNKYYDQIGQGDQLPELRCHKKTKVVKFSLKKLCP